MIAALVAVAALSVPSADTAALQRADRVLGPSVCPVTIHHQVFPSSPQVGMAIFYQPLCRIYVNQTVWTRRMMREVANPGNNGYHQVLWNSYCTYVVRAVALIDGRLSSGARASETCGNHP